MIDGQEIDIFGDDEAEVVSSPSKSRSMHLTTFTPERVAAIRQLSPGELIARMLLGKSKMEDIHTKIANHYMVANWISQKQRTIVVTFLISHEYLMEGIYDPKRHIVSGNPEATEQGITEEYQEDYFRDM